MSEGPYREPPPETKLGTFSVRVEVTIPQKEIADMVREYLLKRGWDPRRLPSKLEIDMDSDEILVTYTLHGTAP